MMDSVSPVVVPRIATERLLLRELKRSDFEAYAENQADPVATEHLNGVSDRRAAWRSFAAATGFWMLDGAGWWGVAHKETDELVGTVGAFFRDTSPELEIGWTVYRRHWRRGFATEAAIAALDFAIEKHGVRRAIAHISPKNIASIRVSQHLHMRFEGEVPFYDGVANRYVFER
jgi:RimJ/RimL family protein N-acetyltransferase